MIAFSFLPLGIRSRIPVFTAVFLAVFAGPAYGQNSASSVPMGSLRSVLLPAMDVRVPAEVDGIVAKYHVAEGDRVEKGDLILELKAEEERLRVAQAEANLMAAKADLKRAEKSLARVEELSKQGIPSEKELETAVFEAERARAAMNQAAASLDLARGAASKKKVSSPVGGVFLKRYKQPGEFVDGNETVARVLDVSTLEMVVYAGSEYWGKFHQGESIQVEITSGPVSGKRLEGEVTFVDQIIDPAAGTFRVKISLEPTEDIVVGLSARIVLP